jgi:hypothetical protein
MALWVGGRERYGELPVVGERLGSDERERGGTRDAERSGGCRLGVVLRCGCVRPPEAR